MRRLTAPGVTKSSPAAVPFVRLVAPEIDRGHIPGRLSVEHYRVGGGVPRLGDAHPPRVIVIGGDADQPAIPDDPAGADGGGATGSERSAFDTARRRQIARSIPVHGHQVFESAAKPIPAYCSSIQAFASFFVMNAISLFL